MEQALHELCILTFVIGLYSTFTSDCKRQIVAAYPKHLKADLSKVLLFSRQLH